MLNCSRIQITSCIAVSATIFATFSPYIFNFDGGREEFNNSSEGDEMRNNLLLKGVELIGIGSSMPLMFTVFLDMVWPTSTSNRFYESASLIAVTVTPMVTHLITSNYHWGPYFTVCATFSATVLWGFLGFSCMWKSISQLAMWSKAALAITPFIYLMGYSLISYDMYISGIVVMVLSSCIFMYGVVVKWVYYTRGKYRSWPWKARLDEDDSKASLWLIMCCFIICT